MTTSDTNPSANPTPVPNAFVGCDVGKATIAIFDSSTGIAYAIPNRPAELAAFAATLGPACLVVCEATGGYEAGLLDAVLRAGRPVHRADARKVKAFIRSFGILGKTDGIDARALSRYGQERHAHLPRWQAPDPVRAELHVLVLTRRDLVDERVACKNRLAAPGMQAVRDCLEAVLACLDTEIAVLEARAAALVAAHKPLRRAVAILRTVKGIGLVTAISVLALMPELGTLHRKQAAALAGLAPHPVQSGARDAYRRTKGGRPEIRKVLFMAALTAAKRDPGLAPFYNRLIANGKKKMLALVAVMRKMIVICNARLQNHNQLTIPAT